MRRLLLAALALVLAGPAAAGTWTWTDAAGEERWTDDPSSVPEARRHTLRHLDEDELGDTFSDVGRPGDAAELPPEDARARVVRLEERRRLLDEAAVLAAELESLRRERAEAEREHRKWKAGGRIGAADRAAAAEARAAELAKRVRAREAKLAALEARLEALGR